MSKLEKFGLLFILLGLQSFRNGGWDGAVGVLFLFVGWAVFTFPAKSAPNTCVQADLLPCGHPKSSLV